MQFYGLTDSDIPKMYQPSFVHSVELDELNIACGLQDRVVQCFEGVVFMDFNREHMETCVLLKRQTDRQADRQTETREETRRGRREREKRRAGEKVFSRWCTSVAVHSHTRSSLHPPHPFFTYSHPHTYSCRHGHGVYEVIDPRVVANAEAGGGTFFIAYEADPSDSGKIHSNVRQKWMDGDEETTKLMSQFATITDDFRTAVEAGDMGRVSSLMADNFALRTSNV